MSFIHAASTYTTTTTTTMSGANPATIVPFLALLFVVILVFIAAGWKVLKKAGKPGWGVLVPFYNMYLFAQVSGKPGWWGIVASLIAVVPVLGWIASTVMTVIMALGLGRNFGKSDLWSIILLWLFPIGSLILGFGKAQYVGNGQEYGGFSLPPVGGQPAQPAAADEQAVATSEAPAAPASEDPVAPQPPVATPTPTVEPQPPVDQPPADNQTPPQSGPTVG